MMQYFISFSKIKNKFKKFFVSRFFDKIHLDDNFNFRYNGQ